MLFPGWMIMTEAQYDQFLVDVYDAVPDIALIHYNVARAKKLFYGKDYARVASRVPTLIGTKAGVSLNDFMGLVVDAPGLNHFVGEVTFALAHQVGSPGMYTSWFLMNPSWAR